jgi:Ras-related protein Rab-8A
LKHTNNIPKQLRARGTPQQQTTQKKILVGNKSDMADERRAVPYARAKALADEYGILFFEASAKDNVNVEGAFTAIARQVMARLQREAADQQAAAAGAGGQGITLTSQLDRAKARRKKGCCES